MSFAVLVLGFLSLFLAVQGQTTFYDVNRTSIDDRLYKHRYLVFPPRVAKPTYRPTVVSTTTTTPSPPLDPKGVDILDLSSSENNPLMAWPRRRLFRPPVVTTTTMRPLVKLQRPRPTRPALYSLDGFVPTPPVNYVYSTEAVPAYNYMYMHGKNDLQTLGSFTKPRKVKSPNHTENEEKRPGKSRYGKVSRRRKVSYSRKGVPGQNFPAYDNIPKTSFDCTQFSAAGMYADPETGCQVWHMCPGGNLPQRHSFLCPNGTIFSASKGICDWWYNVICQQPDDHLRGR